MDKFRQVASQWWDPAGDMKGLHSFNALRVPLVREGILQTRNVAKTTAKSSKPLKDMRIADIGCGGGVLSEPLARLGACIVGIDPAEECIKVAEDHATKDTSISPNLKYICDTAENHVVSNAGLYDAVVASEVAEHVEDLNLLIKTCIKLAKVQGSVFVTTINQTYLAWLFAILVAENVFRVLPRRTHQYEKLVPPQQLEHLFNSNGCQVHRVHGMMYNPFGDKWYWVRDTSLNYAIHAVKLEDKDA